MSDEPPVVVVVPPTETPPDHGARIDALVADNVSLRAELAEIAARQETLAARQETLGDEILADIALAEETLDEIDAEYPDPPVTKDEPVEAPPKRKRSWA